MPCDPIALYDKLNLAENEVQQAMRAARKSDFAKVWVDVGEAEALLNEAKAMCHDDVPHEHDAHEPPPEPPHDHAEADWIRADSIVPIASDFDINAWLSDASIPEASAHGAFRLTGNVSHFSNDDPIVFPGQPGAAHLHMFFGNRTTDAHSTYASLRADPRSTTDSDMLNGSGYWAPALLDGKGNAKVPQHITIYYKRRAAHAPTPYKDSAGNPRQTILAPTGFPAGLRMVFGSNFAADPRPADMAAAFNNTHAAFTLRRGAVLIKQAWTLTEILPLAQAGDTLTMEVVGPDLWDGVHIDSPNHRSHLAYSYRHKWGWMVAPDGYDYEVPVYTLKAVFDILPGEDPLLFRLSSDPEGAVPGSTLHADLFEAWDPTIRQAWTDNALNKGLDCVAGNLGNGKATKRWPGFTFDQQPNLVPVP